MRSPKKLTPRQEEVLRLIAEGAASTEIGEVLRITPRTVRMHVSNLLSKLELESRTQLVAWWFMHRASRH